MGFWGDFPSLRSFTEAELRESSGERQGKSKLMPGVPIREGDQRGGALLDRQKVERENSGTILCTARSWTRWSLGSLPARHIP